MRYDRSLVPSSPSHLILFPSLPTVAPLREWHESEDAKHRNEHGSDESGGTRVTHCHFGSVSTGLSPVTLRYLLIIPVGDPVSPRPSFSPAGETGSAGYGKWSESSSCRIFPVFHSASHHSLAAQSRVLTFHPSFVTRSEPGYARWWRTRWERTRDEDKNAIHLSRLSILSLPFGAEGGPEAEPNGERMG